MSTREITLTVSVTIDDDAYCLDYGLTEEEVGADIAAHVPEMLLDAMQRQASLMGYMTVDLR
jgi:hypothetical protein